jgi:hypothetical protein
MPYKRKTLRNMKPKTRKLARLINELDSTVRRLKNILPEIADAELAERAMDKAQKHQAQGEMQALDTETI